MAATVLLSALLVGCDDGGDERTGAEAAASVPTPFSEALAVVEQITLEETREVLTAAPLITRDSQGGILVADVTAHQVRGYETTGRLLWFQGGEGEGPGEFTHPLAVERVGDLVVAVDLARRLTIWDPRLEQEFRVQNIPDLAIDDIDALDSSRVLLSTRAPGLTLWNITHGHRERDFFTPHIYDEIANQFRSFTSLKSALLEDRIATTVSLYDTVYIHSTEGVEIARYPLGIPNTSRPIPIQGARLREWYTSSQTVEPFWLSQNRLLVSFVDRSATPVDGVTQYGLVVLDLESGGTTLIVDTPRLHFVDGEDLYFHDPSFIEGNHILRARFKGGEG